MVDERTTSPCSASKTGKRPVWVASRATFTVSDGAEPQPSGQVTRMWMYRAPWISMARVTLSSRSCRSATVAVAT